MNWFREHDLIFDALRIALAFVLIALVAKLLSNIGGNNSPPSPPTNNAA